MTRRGHGLSAAIVLSAALVGCTPQSVPTPTPSASTGFSSDAEAFAAAEATYRAYVDALNEVSFADPSTFEAVYAWTSGSLRSADQAGFERSHDAGLNIDGKFRIITMSGHQWNTQTGVALLDACLDVSDVKIADAAGTADGSQDRTPVVPLTLTFESSTKTSTGLTIVDTQPRAQGQAC